MKTEGKLQQAKGDAQQAAGKAKDAASEDADHLPPGESSGFDGQFQHISRRSKWQT